MHVCWKWTLGRRQQADDAMQGGEPEPGIVLE